MITIENVDLKAIKGKNILFGFSRKTGDLTSVALVEKTSDARPSMAGWLRSEYPDDSETEEFRLADAAAWLAVNAPGYGRISKAHLRFNEAGKLVLVQEV